MYFPQRLGARCDVCILNDNRNHGPGHGPTSPVPPETKRGARFTIIGEAPGEQEVKHSRPFVGPSGRALGDALDRAGYSRRDVNLTNALACRPPKNDLGRLMAQLHSMNRARKRRGDAPLPNPMECCRPRLLAEIGKEDKFLTLGGLAAQALMHTRGSVLDIRGGPITAWRTKDGRVLTEQPEHDNGQLHEFKVMPTVHPAFVLRAPRWTEPHQRDVMKARRHFTNTLTWRDPEMTFVPSPEKLADFLGVKKDSSGAYYAVPFLQRALAWDYETDAVEVLDLGVRCLQIGNEAEVVIIPWETCERDDNRSDWSLAMRTTAAVKTGASLRQHYSDAEQAIIDAIVRAWALGPGLKISWNSYFDTQVMEKHLGVTVRGQIDGILVHRLIAAELPHGLGFTGSFYTDVLAWKAGKDAVTANTDYVLWLYGGRDAAVTFAVLRAILPECVERGFGTVRTDLVSTVNQPGGVPRHACTGLLGQDHEIQRVCTVMHKNGMRIDREKLSELTGVYETEAGKWLKRLVGHASTFRSSWRQTGTGKLKPIKHYGYNPGSNVQVGRLFYKDFGITPTIFTDSGDPSVSGAALRAIIFDRTNPPEAIRHAEALRRWRKARKVLTTYLYPMGLPTDRSQTGPDGKERKGWLRPGTDMVHFDWKAHVVVSGRLASSPNGQNIIIALRQVFIPGEGYVFVYADADQLELRIAAARWGAVRYLEAFDKGMDPHQITMLGVFGEEMWGWEGAPPTKATRFYKNDRQYTAATGKKCEPFKIHGYFDAQRGLAKTIQYASQYAATLETVYELIRKAEDRKGNLSYGDLTLEEAKQMHGAWLDACPEFPAGWAAEERMFREKGYSESMISGRQRDLLDGIDLNILANTPIQYTGADIINNATIEIDKEFPLNCDGPGTGLVAQVHDALTLRVLKENGPECAYKLERAMSRDYAQLNGVALKADAKILTRWT